MTNTIQSIITDGASKLHIITDFDRTLTQAFVDGEYKSSLIAVLYTEGYLSDHYQQTAQGYFDHYHPIEIDESIPLEARKQAMTERWTRHKLLLIDEGITKQDIYDAMKQNGMQLRSGAKAFFALCAERDIPIIIFSAGGLGVVSIEHFLAEQNITYPNIHIVSNDFVRDESGRAIDYRKPLIHSLNKDETILPSFDRYERDIADRHNIILLGDSIGDASMADGSDYENVFKIGFLNKDIDKHLARYQEVFDLVITDDGSMDEVNEIIRQLEKSPTHTSRR